MGKQKTVEQIQFANDMIEVNSLLSKYHAAIMIALAPPDENGKIDTSKEIVGGCEECLTASIGYSIENNETIKRILKNAFKSCGYVVLPIQSN